jgi:hypothetical protein
MVGPKQRQDGASGPLLVPQPGTGRCSDSDAEQLIFFNADAQQAEMATWGPPTHLTSEWAYGMNQGMDIYSHLEAMEKTYDETVASGPGREGVYV